jgi:predicted NBD/HSP70 family sugar kinase
MKIVVDLGGSHTRVASSIDGKTIKQKARFNTPQSFDDGVKEITKTIQILSEKKKPVAIVVGIPGTLDHRQGKSIKVPNIPSWNNRDLEYVFQSKLGQPVKFANDAELAALGEANFGIGKAYTVVGYLTVSTGIGGALVANKRLVPRLFNYEPGHMIIDMSSRAKDGTGRKGTLEALASGSTFKDRFGVDPETCTDRNIWKQYAQILAEGICNILLLWSPDILIIGGGFSQHKDLLFSPLRNYVESKLVIFPAPPIVPSALGDEAGLLGGLVFLEK